MYEIVKDFPREMIFKEGKPFISLYQETHRYAPENLKDPIVFRHLIQKVETSLGHKHEKTDIKLIMEPFYQLKEDRAFWNNTMEGLAILAAPGECIIYLLSNPVENLALVANGFHIKPLLWHFQSADAYCVLGLSGDHFSLFEGNRYGLKKIKISAEIARDIGDVLGEEHPDTFLTHGRYGGRDGIATFHGHGGRKDAIDRDLEKFFRYVDKVVLENFSKPRKLPLILASTDKHQSMFRKISNNPYLVRCGIEISYESMDLSRLTIKAWDIMEPLYMGKTLALVDRYRNAKAESLGADELAEVGRVAFEGGVETLFVEADKIIPGRFKADTGEVELGNIDNPEFGDLVDDISKAVLKGKGDVVVLPTERMPTDTGLAAIYRF